MLRFTKFRREERLTVCGLPFSVTREESPVPRIDDQFLDCAVYLYRTREDASQRQRAGGSGFLVAVSAAGAGWVARGECPNNAWHHVYVVSNRHVVKGSSYDKPPAPVVRLNKHDGKWDIVPLTVEDWTLSDEHDLAVVPLEPATSHKYMAVGMNMAVTKELMAAQDIGLGDDVFMVGRFVSHEGEQRNSPSLRYGNISMMPFEPVHHPTNASRVQESFLVEVRTIPGYSGSPVFVRPFPVRKLSIETRTEERPSSRGFVSLIAGPWLLGVEWGAINAHFQGHNTGMSGVVPAWCLLDFLNTENLVAQRKQEQEDILRRHEEGGASLTGAET